MQASQSIQNLSQYDILGCQKHDPLCCFYYGTKKFEEQPNQNKTIYLIVLMEKKRFMEYQYGDHQLTQDQLDVSKETETNIQQELYNLKNNINHQNLMKLIDYNTDEENMIKLIYEYSNTTIDAQSTKDLVSQQNQPIKYFKQLLLGLGTLYYSNILHGHLNTEFIYIEEDKQTQQKYLKLLYIPYYKYVIGKPKFYEQNTSFLEYIDLQLLSSRKFIYQYDIFSLGVIYYFLNFYTTPFKIQIEDQKISNPVLDQILQNQYDGNLFQQDFLNQKVEISQIQTKTLLENVNDQEKKLILNMFKNIDEQSMQKGQSRSTFYEIFEYSVALNDNPQQEEKNCTAFCGAQTYIEGIFQKIYQPGQENILNSQSYKQEIQLYQQPQQSIEYQQQQAQENQEENKQDSEDESQTIKKTMLYPSIPQVIKSEGKQNLQIQQQVPQADKSQKVEISIGNTSLNKLKSISQVNQVIQSQQQENLQEDAEFNQSYTPKDFEYTRKPDSTIEKQKPIELPKRKSNIQQNQIPDNQVPQSQLNLIKEEPNVDEECDILSEDMDEKTENILVSRQIRQEVDGGIQKLNKKIVNQSQKLKASYNLYNNEKFTILEDLQFVDCYQNILEKIIFISTQLEQVVYNDYNCQLMKYPNMIKFLLKKMIIVMLYQFYQDVIKKINIFQVQDFDSMIQTEEFCQFFLILKNHYNIQFNDQNTDLQKYYNKAIIEYDKLKQNIQDQVFLIDLKTILNPNKLANKNISLIQYILIKSFQIELKTHSEKCKLQFGLYLILNMNNTAVSQQVQVNNYWSCLKQQTYNIKDPQYEFWKAINQWWHKNGNRDAQIQMQLIQDFYQKR